MKARWILIIISIPYGAIKSFSARIKCKRMLLISIPYGAIKRIVFPEVFFIELLFQFLMVRLKGKFQQLRSFPISNFNSLWCD